MGILIGVSIIFVMGVIIKYIRQRLFCETGSQPTSRPRRLRPDVIVLLPESTPVYDTIPEWVAFLETASYPDLINNPASFYEKIGVDGELKGTDVPMYPSIEISEPSTQELDGSQASTPIKRTDKRPPSAIYPDGWVAENEDRSVQSGVTDSEPMCAICLDGYDTMPLATRLPCGHIFHYLCLSSWFMRCDTCPLCKLVIPTRLPGMN